MVIIADPVGDMLIRIRNGYLADRKAVNVPYSKEKEAVAKVLVKNQIVTKCEIEGEKFEKALVLTLDKERKELMVKRISKPGRRLYVRSNKFYSVKGGRGLLIVSTSKGIMDSKEAHKLKIGGELLAELF